VVSDARRHGNEEAVLAGRRPVLELLRAGRSARKVLIADGMKQSPVIGEIRRRAEELAIPVRFVPREQIDRTARGLNHQGVAAITGRFRYTPLEKLLVGDRPCVLFLDAITDPQNLGSLLRSADCVGFSGIVIPAHRSASVTPAVRRVSAGASEVVPVARVTNLGRALDEARSAGLWILGLDEDASGDLWSSDLAEPPVGLVLGAEDRGISKSVRARCDEVVRIPQGGRIGSLNVAVAGAVAMFEVARRRSAGAGTDSATL
jgi:23S rRNA (guanosine2251-2'-O)-methyltransferase